MCAPRSAPTLITMKLTYLLAPLLLFGYGVVRLLDGLDGTHGPGPAWTIGHLLFLASLVGFGLVALDLRQRLGTRLALVTLIGTLYGLFAFVHVVALDLAVGFGAADRAEMDLRYDRYRSIADSVLDPFSPLFPVGITVLLILLVVARRAPWWSPVLALAGFLAIVANLDLLPLAGLLLVGALLPVARSAGRGAPHRSPVGAGRAG